MISLLLAALRLSCVLAAFVWLPGWIATARPLRPFRVLHALTFGVLVHALALVVVSISTARVSTAMWLLPVASFGVAFVVRALVRRLDSAWDPPTLPRAGSMMIAGVVGLALLLRWFHNFHYDDLEHLLYLTELLRVDRLFPDAFALELTHLRLPQVGEGSVSLSRYPYWAVSYALLGRLASITPGDTYLLLGLGILAFTLSVMTAHASRAWTVRGGLLWVLVLLAVSPWANDNVLNYGGYPFQTGKLFMLMAGTAVAVAWSTRRREHLMPAVAGLFVAPLVHTNNAVGVICVGVLGLTACLIRPSLRRATWLVVVPFVLLGLTAAASVASNGFMRWTPVGASQAIAPPPPPPSSPSSPRQPAPPVVAAPQPAPMDTVGRRLALFLDRGAPSELIGLLAAVILLPLFGGYAGVLRRLAPPAIVAAALVTIGVSALELGRAVVTSAFKPGYFVMRSELMEAAPLVPADRPAVADPITSVFGRAAGWPLVGEAPMRPQDQTSLLALYHPAIRGEALDVVLDSIGLAAVIANERIIGVAASDKLAHAPALDLVGRTHGQPAPIEEDLSVRISGLRDEVQRHGFGVLASETPSLADAFARALFVDHPVSVFAHQGRAAHPLDTSALGEALRGAGLPASGSGERYLNSVLTVLPPLPGCAASVSLKLENEGSFGASLMVQPLGPFAADPSSQGLALDTGRAAFDVRLSAPVCDLPPQPLFIHLDRWWDARFSVTSLGWGPDRAGSTHAPE